MPDSIFTTTTNVNTILGLVNQLAVQMDAPLSPLLDTTINTKRQVQPNILPASHPTLKYFGVGINGYFNIDDSNLAQPYIPSEENMDLYTPIPFRVVPKDADIDAIERAKYRIRTLESFGGNDYWVYWLKLIEFPNPDISVKRVNLLDNTETDYIFDPSNLNPVPVKTNGVDTVDDVTEKIVVSSEGEVEVSGAEIAEAINIIYAGDFRYARISEYGFYTGEDQIVSGLDGDDLPFDYTEAIYSQLATHRCTLGVDVSNPATIVTETVRYSNMSHYLI